MSSICPCPTLDPAEIRRQLDEIDAAIGVLASGKRLTEITVGSREFSRTWRYSEVNLAALRAYRADLAALLASLCGCPPTFRANATIPLIVPKWGV